MIEVKGGEMFDKKCLSELNIHHLCFHSQFCIEIRTKMFAMKFFLLILFIFVSGIIAPNPCVKKICDTAPDGAMICLSQR